MADHIQQSGTDLKNELENERDLRKKYEAEATARKHELIEAETTLEKYKRMPAKLEKYRHRAHKLKRQRNMYGGLVVFLVLVVSYFLIERFQRSKELDTLRREGKAAGAPKKMLPGIITQEAMERDAERQGGSHITDPDEKDN